MPEILAMVQASVEVTSSVGSSLVADVSVDNPDATNQVVADVEVDGAGGEAAESRTYQKAYFEIDIDNATLGDANRIGAMRVSRSLNKTIQDAKFTVHLPNATGPIGNPFTHSGPATCKREVSIFGVYKVNGTEYRVPLISKGIGAVSERVASKSLVYESFDVLDRGARYDQARVSKRIPAGSGLNRDRVARIFAEEADVEDIVFEQCAPTNRELAIAEGEWIGPVAEQCFDVELRKMLWNVFGDLYNPRFSAPSLHGSEEPTVWVWGPHSFSDEHDIRVVWKNDIYTRAHLFGSAPVLVTECPSIPTENRSEGRSVYSPVKPQFRQTTSGYTSNGSSPESSQILTSLKIHEKTTKCGTLIYERVRTWGYYNPRSVRYEWDSIDSEWDRVSNVYTNENFDGDGEAYQDPKELWYLLDVEEKWHFYLQTGYRYGEHGINFGPVPGGRANQMLSNLTFPEDESLDWEIPAGYDIIVGKQAGIKLGSIRRKWEWYAPAAHVKDRFGEDIDTPWSVIEPPNGKAVFGNKTSFRDNITGEYGQFITESYPPQSSTQYGETFLLKQLDIECLDSNGDNYSTGIRRMSMGWFARSGSRFYYGEGDVRGEGSESFVETDYFTETYVEKSKVSHDILRSLNGPEGPLPSVSEFDVPSYLPPAEFIALEYPTIDDGYDSEEELLALSSGVITTESQELEVEVVADDLEVCHFQKIYEGEYENAENSEELDRAGRGLIAENAAGEFSATLAGANFYVREGQLAICDDERIGLETPYLIRIEDVEHSQDRPNGKILTSVKGKIYVW